MSSLNSFSCHVVLDPSYSFSGSYPPVISYSNSLLIMILVLMFLPVFCYFNMPSKSSVNE